jgi:hypothetical protein
MSRPKGTTKYDKEYCVRKAKEIIANDPSILFIVDLMSQFPICQKTFYDKVRPDSPEMQEILDALEVNRVAMKQKIRSKLMDMNNPTAMIVLYKLIGDKDERAALSSARQSYTDEPVNANIELKFS